ncbi:MAG: TetR/AcrR family transcriptional regulator [Propionibacteriaceae bacterium]|jgi:AcrR family transcriptional regulator|nr:TetR/AcrR family transcriptional regulator [Propionibacteriaceae bacterium]
MGSTKPRGPYRKSDERRTEILQAALEAYATSDAGGPTLKAIGDKVGLTESALLYHFGSREELFWAIVKARDESDRFQVDDEEVTATDFTRLGQMIAHNASTPGLVKLFLEQAVAAVSPSHPAHDELRARYERFNAVLAQGLSGLKGLPPDQAAWLARIVIAASDGLQIQWLLDPSIDMRADLDALIALATEALGE